MISPLFRRSNSVGCNDVPLHFTEIISPFMPGGRTRPPEPNIYVFMICLLFSLRNTDLVIHADVTVEAARSRKVPVLVVDDEEHGPDTRARCIAINVAEGKGGTQVSVCSMMRLHSES